MLTREAIEFEGDIKLTILFLREKKFPNRNTILVS
jgi:hypothetical protein